MKRFFLLLALSLTILGVDFLSKDYVLTNIPLMNWSSTQYPYGGLSIFENWQGIDFSINHVTNKGAAWGMFASWSSALLYIRLVVIAGIIFYLFFSPRSRAKQFPLTLIVSGALGNVLDYFLYGHVIDMFHFKFWGYTYPIFNVADSSIFCGIAWLFLQSFKRQSAAVKS